MVIITRAVLHPDGCLAGLLPVRGRRRPSATNLPAHGVGDPSAVKVWCSRRPPTGGLARRASCRDGRRTTRSAGRIRCIDAPARPGRHHSTRTTPGHLAVCLSGHRALPAATGFTRTSAGIRAIRHAAYGVPVSHAALLGSPGQIAVTIRIAPARRPSRRHPADRCRMVVPPLPEGASTTRFPNRTVRTPRFVPQRSSVAVRRGSRCICLDDSSRPSRTGEPELHHGQSHIRMAGARARPRGDASHNQPCDRAKPSAERPASWRRCYAGGRTGHAATRRWRPMSPDRPTLVRERR